MKRDKKKKAKNEENDEKVGIHKWFDNRFGIS